jgi:hypothetical protein
MRGRQKSLLSSVDATEQLMASACVLLPSLRCSAECMNACTLYVRRPTTKVIGPSLRHYPTKLQLSLLPSILPTGVTFVVLIPTFQFSHFFKMIHNALNPSLNPNLLKVFPYSYPCLNSFFVGLKMAFFCSNSFKIHSSRLNYIEI